MAVECIGYDSSLLLGCLVPVTRARISGAYYLSSAASGLCLNVDGCQTDLIYYECVTSVSGIPWCRPLFG